MLSGECDSLDDPNGSSDSTNPQMSCHCNAGSAPVFVVDEQFRLISANQGLAACLGLPLDRVLGQRCCRLIHGQDDPPSFCPHDEVMGNGHGVRFQCDESALRGRFEFEVSSVFQMDGGVLGAVHVGKVLGEPAALGTAPAKELVNICSRCKKIRDENGNWWQLEHYLSRKMHIEFSHGLCPDCIDKLYPELELEGIVDPETI